MVDCFSDSLVNSDQFSTSLVLLKMEYFKSTIKPVYCYLGLKVYTKNRGLFNIILVPCSRLVDTKETSMVR